MESRDTAVNQLKSWITTNRERLLEAGIASILARYGGEGDSGSLEDEIEFLTPDERLASPYDSDTLIPLFEKLHDALAPFGYENKDGGGGQFQIDVNTGALMHESYFLYTERSYNEVEESDRPRVGACKVKCPPIWRPPSRLPSHTSVVRRK